MHAICIQIYFPSVNIPVHIYIYIHTEIDIDIPWLPGQPGLLVIESRQLLAKPPDEFH